MRIELIVEHNPKQLKRTIQRLFKQRLITEAIRLLDTNHYAQLQDWTIKKTHSMIVRFKCVENVVGVEEKVRKVVSEMIQVYSA